MPRTHSRATEGSAHIDMTSLMDVVFIILVFFVVTSSFVSEAGLHFSRPTVDRGRLDGPPTVPIRIDAANNIIIDGYNVDPRAVRANLERMKAQQPDAGFVVIAGREADVRTLVGVVDAARAAGIERLPVAALQE